MAIILGSTSAGTLGTVTVAEVKSIVQAHGYDTDTSPEQTTLLREVLRRFYGMRRWKFLLQESTLFDATIANTGIVDLSTLGRGIQIESVRIGQGTDFNDMDPVDRDRMEYLRHQDPTAGPPSLWSRYNDSVVVYPVPDGTYDLTVVYQALSMLPSADGDSIVWPETHLDVIVYAIILRLAWRQRDWSGLDRARAEFGLAFNEMAADEGMDQRQAATHVKKWVGWTYMDGR